MRRNCILEFGEGRLIVDTGTYGGKPAVFVAPTARPGVVGELVLDQVKTPLDRLEPGEVVMTFPTMKQARVVADTLRGRVLNGDWR